MNGPPGEVPEVLEVPWSLNGPPGEVPEVLEVLEVLEWPGGDRKNSRDSARESLNLRCGNFVSVVLV